MRDFAIVKGIEGERIEVVSLISDACVTCNSIECARKGLSFHVINKKKLPVKVNDVIRIGFPRILSGFLRLLSLVFPISAAILGFLVSPRILEDFDFPCTEANQALCVGAFFLASTLLVFVISRTDVHLTHPEVMQIM